MSRTPISTQRKKIDHDADFALWGITDIHVPTDLNNGYKSLQTALIQAQHAGSGNNKKINWDIAINAGDYAGESEPDDQDGQDILDQFRAAGVDQNRVYGIPGNHDANLNDLSWYEKWVDPRGENTEFSGISNSLRPYPVYGDEEYNYFEVGNILFLMLNDINYGGEPFGRQAAHGYPGGRYTSKQYNWWVSMIEANPDKIIITYAHHGLYDTTIYTGFHEGTNESIHGNFNWFDDKYSSMVGAIDEQTIDGYDSTNTYTGVIPPNFKTYLEANNGAIDFWLFGHSHRFLYPGKSFNSRSDVETKHGVNFVNLGGLTKYHAGLDAVFSRYFLFNNGSDQVKMKTYVHSTDWTEPEGFYDAVEQTFTVSQNFIQ